MGYKLETIQKIKEVQLNSYRKLAEAISEDNEDKFNHIVSEEMMNIANADGITFYNKSLEFKILKNRSMKLYMGGTSNKEIKIPSVMLFDESGKPNLKLMTSMTFHTKKKIIINDVYKYNGKYKLEFQGPRNFDKATGYRTKSLLTMPIIDYEGKAQGVIQMVNAQDFETGRTIQFNKQIVSDLENFTIQVGSYMNQRKLLQDMENLFESLIQLIAKAIDKKSHYTGKHCERVPVLTEMISKELCKQKNGKFKDFNLSKDEENELRISAWLHDAGKIATPPHVNDKATKLERIIDGIELIEHRIEILKKETENTFLKEKINYIKSNDNNGIEKAEKLMNNKIDLYNDYLNVLNEVNIGGEELSKHKINQITKAHKEKLLVNGKILNLLDDYEKNALSIQRGTLDDNERNKINEHVSITYELLNEIPFPDSLKDVPIIASNHHEKLDGSGYPFGKKEKELSIQSRVLGFSDIFEALTAPDRPYKTANTLSESLDIMYQMCNNGKIDKDIFQVFLNKKLFLKYAKKHIHKNQIDEVDIRKYSFS